MPNRYQLISVRLDRETLNRLELVAGEYPQKPPDERATPHHRGFTRSAMIRHAITTGLDALTHVPPLKL